MDEALRIKKWLREGASALSKANKEKNTSLIKMKKRFKSVGTNHHKDQAKKTIRNLNGGRHDSYKNKGTKRLTSGRLKPRKLQEGLFLKGLRTRYVNRDSLNEADDARRDEDLNRIIDLGKGIDLSGDKIRSERVGDNSEETSSSSSSNEDIETTLKEENKSKFGNYFSLEECEECDLSPIRFPESSTSSGSDVRISSSKNPVKSHTKMKKIKKKQEDACIIDFQAQFLEFASSLEEISNSDILLRLPENGILEEAAESLRNLYVSCKKETKNEERNVDAYRKEHSMENQHQSDYDLFVNEALNLNEKRNQSPQRFLPADSNNFQKLMKLNDCDTATQSCIVTPIDFNFDKCFKDSKPFYFNSGIEYLKEMNYDEKKESENLSLRRLSFDTPPMQFYRRNMF